MTTTCSHTAEPAAPQPGADPAAPQCLAEPAAPQCLADPAAPQPGAEPPARQPRAEPPVWRLEDLFPASDSPELAAAMDAAGVAAKAFQDRCKDRLVEFDGAALGAAIAEYERIEAGLGRVMSYAHLLYAGDMTAPEIGRFFQSVQERVNAISLLLVFFTLEINRIAPERIEALAADAPELARYRPWLRDLQVFRPHQLRDDLEQLLHEKHVVGRAAWNRLFDETIAELRFPICGEALTCSDALNRFTDVDPAVRRQAGEVVGRVLGEHRRTFALITNTLIKDKEIEDRWRAYPHPAAARHLSNRVEPEVVAALVAAVREAYPVLSHRYYRLKAGWFGGTQLDYWDRNAPLPELGDRVIPWPEAQTLVLDAFAGFSPRMAEVGRRFFDHGWIDAATRPGKAPGAFAHPTVPTVHPYILLNYHGKTRDVMTLAHELGHGVHQVLAGGQGYLLADTPLTLAETASVFGEMLTFRSLLAAESDPQRRWAMRAGKVEDMLNTVVRQIAFYDFETRLHLERRQGEVTAERIGEIWLAVQQESLGPAVRFDDGYRNFWAYIPHFVHSPFYVYAYAFGDCLVNSLYAVYQDGAPGFAEKYLELLSAGGTLRHRDLLAPFGLDASEPEFWRRGLDMIRGMIDDLGATAPVLPPAGAPFPVCVPAAPAIR